MDISKVDLLLQYALAIAGQGDEYFQRQLGPIHLVKYVYLADLSHAERNQGRTYTGIEWRFHKFGPWSTEVFKRIEPALTVVGATKTEISHPKYEDDFVRWILTDDDLVLQLAAKLPLYACLAIQSAVRQFGSDTPSLLNHVYLTRPMLRAAPGEFLDFSPEEKNEQAFPESPSVRLTKMQKEHRKKELQDLKARIQAKLAEKKKYRRLVPPDPPPRYDEIFIEGRKWLDELAGASIEAREERARFSEDVWKSPARFDPDVS
ncbi:MAG: hypothetical protein JRJ11_07715 [Deltaproteobacteria bacterium]|nr:hypothetical protein [Deltaproteobacteria bacterium]MBW1909407.1 hypothetical protein [Deltaproteobacteria bacterium]